MQRSRPISLIEPGVPVIKFIKLKNSGQGFELDNEMLIRMETTTEHEILHEMFILISNIKESQKQTHKIQ